jgi:hypothetical protein
MISIARLAGLPAAHAWAGAPLVTGDWGTARRVLVDSDADRASWA